MHIVQCAVSAVLIWSLAANLPAAPAQPVDLTSAVKRAAQVARQREYKSVLVVVFSESRNKSESGDRLIIKGLQEAIVKKLKAEKANVAMAPEVPKWISMQQLKGNLSLRQFRELERLADFDILLSARYRKRGKSRSLKLVLLDYRKRLWAETVNLQQHAKPSDSELKKKRAKSTSSPSANGNEQINRLAKILSGLPPLNRKVLAFALSQLGKKVGNGECWTLGAEALRFAGAQPPQGYTFGRLIRTNQVQPGDILQFLSARFQIGDSSLLFGVPDHTAVVEALQGSKITILHQNFGQKIVTRLIIDVTQMTSGRISVYRPVP